MKSRPESRQKTDEDAATTSPGKEKKIDNIFTAVAASKSTVKVPSLMRIKSAKSGKSLTRIAKVENAKNQAIRKLKGNRRESKSTPKEDTPSLHPKNLPIWDEKLDKLCISKKTTEMIDKEIGLRYIYISPPTPSIYDVEVQKPIPADRLNRRKVSVMRPINKGHLYVSPELFGPKYDKFGQIVPHSILGDVNEFMKHAHIQQQKIPVMVEPCKSTVSKTNVPGTSDYVYKPHFDESRALNTWNNEMKQRKYTQEQLADLLKRPVDHLLMYKSDMYDRKCDMTRLIEHYKQHYHPDYCFWNIPDQQGTCQIRETLTKCNRGYLSSPVICGDAESVLTEKGKVNKQSVCAWSDNDYCKQRIQETHGIIKISNNILFEELDVRGEAFQAEGSLKKMNEKGDNKSTNKEVHFELSKMTTVAKSSVMHRQNSCDTQSAVSDQSIKQENLECPALLIDDTVLKWRDRKDGGGSHDDQNISSKICKEVIVLIQSNFGEVKEGFAKIKNCGNTVIRYSWTKVPAQRLLPIPRPSRKYFYFIEDDGAIFPNETLYVPMLFRGKTPGYFTESWLLSTTPLLEGGAKVKFTFKGVATGKEDFSEQVMEIEDYLLRNQIATICQTEVKHVIDDAILKGSLKDGRLREDEPDPLLYEELFRWANPKLYYHCHIVRKLELLEKTLTNDSTEKKQETNGNESQHVISVGKLIELILSMPDDDTDDHHDNITPSTSPTTDSISKELLLRQLNEDIMVLGMTPFTRMDSRFQYRFGIMYTQLQGCIDGFVLYAWEMGDKLQLSAIEDEKTKETESKKETKGKTKGRAVKGSKKTTESPDLRSVSVSTLSPENKCEVPIFSNVHKCRQDETGKYKQKLDMYDEKTYIEMYRLLSSALDQMAEFFQ